MAESFTVGVREMESCGQVYRKNAIVGTSSVTLLPAPGAGLKYLILGIQVTAASVSVFSMTGLNASEQASGAKFVLNCPIGGVSYNAPMYTGVFSTAANTALTILSSTTGDNAVFIQYVITRA